MLAVLKALSRHLSNTSKPASVPWLQSGLVAGVGVPVECLHLRMPPIVCSQQKCSDYPLLQRYIVACRTVAVLRCVAVLKLEAAEAADAKASAKVPKGYGPENWSSLQTSDSSSKKAAL